MFIDLTTIPASTIPGLPGGLTGLVHDALQKSATEPLGDIGNPLAPQNSVYWTSILNRALNESYWFIVDSFLKRGFSKAIIDQWDRGIEYQSDLGVWYALQWIATQTSVKLDQDALNVVDRRYELTGRSRAALFNVQAIQPVGLTIGGIWQWPDTAVGQASTGPVEETVCLNPFNTRMSRDQPDNVQPPI